jgi:demethylspheroidene O-methyltransferase
MRLDKRSWLDRSRLDGSWLDRLWSYRDRLIANPNFQRWTLANPLTRRIAQKHARAAFDLSAGFVYSQVLFACARLRLFDILLEEPHTAAALAEKLALSPQATERLLDAAASLGLAERRSGDRYGLGRIGAALAGNRTALALIEHQPMLYADLLDPVALLRDARTDGAALARYWPYSAATRPAALTPEQVAAYSALMAASQPLVAQEALGCYPIQRHRALLDVGGGEGVFLAAAAERAPHLRLMLFDLPAVAERARERLSQAGLLERASIHGGDFLNDPLPEGADLISLIRIVHDHDDASALALLRNVRRALPDDGALLIVEAISGAKGAEPLDAYYGFYTLAMGRGEPRTIAEIGALLRQAGFSRFRLLRNRMRILTSVIVAWPDA